MYTPSRTGITARRYCIREEEKTKGYLSNHRSLSSACTQLLCSRLCEFDGISSQKIEHLPKGYRLSFLSVRFERGWIQTHICGHVITHPSNSSGQTRQNAFCSPELEGFSQQNIFLIPLRVSPTGWIETLCCIKLLKNSIRRVLAFQLLVQMKLRCRIPDDGRMKLRRN